jgi:predicted nuclease of restriction endonuclease-like RecB superfamily
LLTADLVHARRRGDELKLVPLDAAARARATALATTLLGLARAHVGQRRADFDEACAAVEVAPRERRLFDGLCKLIEDRCEFAAEAPLEPEELRRTVFAAASAARRAGAFDRRALLEAVAAEHGLPVDAIEPGLYADLRAAHLLRAVEAIGAARLVDDYELGQAQAVLLRASRVIVDVSCATPGAYRALFHKLKFLRLLYTIEPRGQGGYRLIIDGPFSLFESVTKYGLALALALPAIRACDTFRLAAEVRWGKERRALTFRLEGTSGAGASDDGAPPRLADEVARLLADLGALDSPWQAAPSTDIVHLPGVGLCVPDLVFSHSSTGECVYLEVLGYWSRAAVWRRVELVERGLDVRILFAISQHLRVSEEALGDDQPSALYVYKKVMSARTVLERVAALAARPSRAAP